MSEFITLGHLLLSQLQPHAKSEKRPDRCKVNQKGVNNLPVLILTLGYRRRLTHSKIFSLVLLHQQNVVAYLLLPKYNSSFFIVYVVLMLLLRYIECIAYINSTVCVHGKETNMSSSVNPVLTGVF